MPPYNPLAEMIKALIGLVFDIFLIPFRLLGLVRRVAGRRQLSPYELNRRRATIAAFVAGICLYVLHNGAWLFGQLPPWVPHALIAAAGLSLLFLLAGFYGARNGPRDPFGSLASLVIAGGCAALLWWQWYLPPDYGSVADDANWALAGLYLAALIAALVRAVICAQLSGGAARVVERAIRRRTQRLRPVLMSGGRPWRD
jgi:hypothetical protein